MAEGDGKIYFTFAEKVLSGLIDLATAGDTIKVGLVTAHTPDQDAHDVWSDVSGDEEAGPGYTAGGETLGSQTVSIDSGNNRASFDGANVTWTGLDVGTPSHAIMYSVTASNALIAYWELTTASNGGDYTLQWHVDGIILLTVPIV